MGSDGFLAVLVLRLHLPDAHSLKARRHELAPVKAHLRGRLGASVAEVDVDDRWQWATLLVTLAASSPGALESEVDRIEAWLDARFPEGVGVERTVLSVEDLRTAGLVAPWE